MGLFERDVSLERLSELVEFLHLLFGLFPAVGLPIAGILGTFAQIIYVVAMPILLVAFIIRVA